MNELFTEFLNEIQADPDMIQQALRMHLSERTDDRTDGEMLTDLHTAATTKDELDQLLVQLKQDPNVLEQAALVYFEYAWEDDRQRHSIRTAFEQAKDRLPVIEVTVLAIAAMYGMYLAKTGGVTKIERTIEKDSKGKYKETVKIEKEPFTPIISAMTRILQLFKRPAP